MQGETGCEIVSHRNETIASEQVGFEGEFRHLTNWWKRDSEFQSSSSQIAMHSAYRQIIEMGSEVLPLILRDLTTTKAPWFWALQAITGEDPVPADDRGHIDRMVQAWARWGIQRNLI
jgi:hypothetical protein